jgi:hypothetical protein
MRLQRSEVYISAPAVAESGGTVSNFSPAVADKACKAMRAEIRDWKLHLRSGKSIEDLSRMFNSEIRGWLHRFA